MAGKIHVFLVGLGVFLMLAAGGYLVRLVLSGSPEERDTTATPTGSRTGNATPSPTPGPSTSAAMPSPTTPRPSTTTSRPPTTAPPPAPTWHQVFFDDFNDLAHWAPANDVAGSDTSCLRAANAVVSGGILILQAKAEAVTCGTAGMRAYTTASVASSNAFVYAAFEVRARGPVGATLGLSATSWIGEVPLCSPNADWHTYRTEWEAGVIRRYVDDYQVSSMDTAISPGGGQTIHLALNVGAPDGTTAFPAELQIDFVKVYTH